MKKVFHSFILSGTLFFVLFVCAFIVVCNTYFPFGYYAGHFTQIRNIGGMQIWAVIIGFLSFSMYVYSLWCRAENAVTIFKKYFDRINFYLLSFIILILLLLGAYVVALQIHLAITILIAPFMAYCLAMFWLYAGIYHLQKSGSAKSIPWIQFYKQFPIHDPIGLLMSLLLSSGILLFLFEVLVVNERRAGYIFLSFLLVVLLTILASSLSKFAKIRSDEYEKVMTEKIKTERFKTELITNVSHDIKTPLTSIINYVDFINKMDFEDEELKRYAGVLEKKSLRLKMLIEDLIEASKAGTGNIAVNLEAINLVELVGQITGEFDEQMTSNHLQVIEDVSENKILIDSDGRHVWRVMENVFGNAVKYAMQGTRIYVSLKKEADKTIFSLKNVSKEPLNMSPDELTQQFVRGDQARFSEGSGLGLYIARSLTEAIGGQFNIFISGDLFEVTIIFRNAE